MGDVYDQDKLYTSMILSKNSFKSIFIKRVMSEEIVKQVKELSA